ncbi:hypothetical protein QU38_00880, partial [Staphylococcus aureus]
GFGDVERDLAFAQGVEDRRCQRGEAQAPLDEATCHAETLCDSIEIAGRADEVLKGAAFLGGGHLELMEVGRRGRFGQFGIVAGKDHDGDIEIGFRDRTALGEQAKRAPTASAIEDLEGAARLFGGRDEQILKDALG